MKASGKRPNVLFLSTGNSARSIVAEAILQRESMGRFRSYSAGSHANGEPHPYALELLTNLNHDVRYLRSKSWNEFSNPPAPKLDFVFTVCNRVIANECPVWPGKPVMAHWGMPDPTLVTGSEAERRVAFSETYRMLRNRISAFVNLPLESLDRISLQSSLVQIGVRDGNDILSAMRRYRERANV